MRQHPAVRGIVEHHERAELFAAEAAALPDPQAAFRHWMVAVYSLRAALELMREAAKRGQLRVDLERLDHVMALLIPRYRLIHQIRIRDFHHYGVLGPGHMLLEIQVRLPAYGRGTIELRADPSSPGLRVGVSDGSRNYSYFLTAGLLVQDHLEPVPIPLPQLVTEQLTQLPRALRTFLLLLRS